MSDAPQTASMPLVELGPRSRIVLEARDPVTGAAVAGVVVTGARISYERDTGSEPGPLPAALLAHLPTSV